MKPPLTPPVQGGELSYLCNGYMTAQPFPSFSKGGVRGGLSEMSQPLYSPEGTTDYRQGHRPCIMAPLSHNSPEGTAESRQGQRPCIMAPPHKSPEGTADPAHRFRRPFRAHFVPPIRRGVAPACIPSPLRDCKEVGTSLTNHPCPLLWKRRGRAAH